MSSINLPEAFKEAMKKLIPDEYDSFISAYDAPAKKGLRVNTLRVSVKDFLQRVPQGVRLTQSALLKEGFIVNDDSALGKHPYHTAGVYYLQEPSAMSVAAELADFPFNEDTRVLDLCAAPGGKTGAIAAYMNGKGMLVANEIVRKRAEELAKNVERLGITNAVVSNLHPEKIAELCSEQFDIVVVDAPCSGEGMFRKNPAAVSEWSYEHVLSCAVRQAAILESAEKCLKKGGVLLYSTCTFSVEENENVVEDFCRKHPFEIMNMHRLFPHSSEGEGHFVCKMLKKEGRFTEKNKTVRRRDANNEYSLCKDRVFHDFAVDTFISAPNAEAFISRGGRVIYASKAMTEVARDLRSVIACGVHAGFVKNYFEPSHTLFMSAYPEVEYRLETDLPLESAQLRAFLHGESIDSPFPESEKGCCLIKAGGFPIGFAKVSDGMLKNRLPKGLRKN